MRNTALNKLGLWLDHSRAHFIDISKGPAIVQTIFSNQETNLRYNGETGTGIRLGNNRSTNNEHHHHNREQELKHEYFKLLAQSLQNYDDILLFGATTAKDELYNYLKADKHFNNKTIEVKPADHLTENQMVAEVKKHFNV